MLKPVATIELVYIDETGSTSAVVVNVPSSTTIAVMDATATALASLIAPMTDCVLARVRHSYRNQIIANISDAGSSPITVAGMFFFEDFDGINLGVVQVPALKDALIRTTGTGAGVSIDLTASDVVDFISFLLDNSACNPMGDVFYHLRAAYRQSRV